MISLDSFCGGAILERFATIIAQVGNNILDPNTDPEKARTITIKLTFKPDKARKGIKTSAALNYTLAPPLVDETLMLIGRDYKTGQIEMSEHGNPGQVMKTADTCTAVSAQVMAPQRSQPVPAFDPGTGEIYDGVVQGQRGPIDLRAAN